MEKGLPTPPMEDNIKMNTGARRNTASSTKSVKPVHRNSKRASQTSHSPVHDHAPLSPHSSNMDRHKRVWKACERCRQKKTKCDGEFPCKRCKDDGLVCTAGTRKKTEYKQLPRGYVLYMVICNSSSTNNIGKLRGGLGKHSACLDCHCSQIVCHGTDWSTVGPRGA